jgi:hypothetical protein
MNMVSLKPQDVAVVLKLALQAAERPSYAQLAADLGLSASEAHAAVRRAQQVGLVDADRRPNRTALLEFLVHGLKYVFAAVRGPVTRGMPTAHAAPPLEAELAGGGDLPPVWPSPEGTVRGEALEPLYRSAVKAAQRDPQLYECLALIDAIRSGRARERKLAEQHLRNILSHGG